MAVPLIAIPFLWEVFRRFPLPIIFNRRTREVYYDNNGELYHAPWDDLKALVCEFQLSGPYTAGLSNTSLEIMVHQFCNTENALMISRWPKIVLERLRGDGPSTRLIDLEKEANA